MVTPSHHCTLDNYELLNSRFALEHIALEHITLEHIALEHRYNLKIKNTIFTFAQDHDSGIVVRDASIVLGSYFYHNQMMFSSKSYDVLELKSQCGVAGIVCASCGCGSVMLTDRHEALPLLRNNVSMNEDAVETCIVAPFEILSLIHI